jgi:hypothetical protein
MKRLRLLVLAMAVAFATAAGATAAIDLVEFNSAVDAMKAVDPTLDPPPADDRTDFVVGGFDRHLTTTSGIDIVVHHAISARLSPRGEVQGQLVRTIVQSDRAHVATEVNRVTCLAIVGNNASVGMVVKQSSGEFAGAPGSPSVIVLHDSGLPGGTGDTMTSLGRSDRDCPLYAGLIPPIPITHGNIHVHNGVLP